MINPTISIDDLNKLGENTIGSHIGIIFTEIGKDYLSGKMPVDQRTKQPYGILHGGASVVLAETLGSMASAMCVDQNKFITVGLEINANHVRSVSDGYVYGKAQLIHLGKKTHIWDIRIVNEKEELTCISRITIAVLEKLK
jgi:1,4-dihydroxy-2-naphthoyl-CoA hydrolase